MKIYEIEFEGIYPVGNCLIIAASNEIEALNIARETITHTGEFVMKEVKLDKAKVIVYLS